MPLMVMQVFHSNAAMQGLYDLAADGQAKAGMLAKVLVFGAFRIKTVKNGIQLGLRNPRPFIRHANPDHLAIGRGMQGDLPLGGRERYGIADQVAEYLHQTVFHSQRGQRVFGRVILHVGHNNRLTVLTCCLMDLG